MGFIKFINDRPWETMGGFAHDPGTLSIIAIGASILGTVTGAVGAHNAGVAQQQGANYDAQIAGLQGQIAQKNAIAQQNELNYEAGEAKTQAGQALASSQQKQILDQRQTAIAESRARALSAAGGGGSLDPSVVNVMGDLQTEGDYRAGVAKYEGSSQAASLTDTANLKTYEGEMARVGGNNQAAIYDASATMDRAAGQNAYNAGNMSAFSTILKGAGTTATMYDKYSSGTSSDVSSGWDGNAYSTY